LFGAAMQNPFVLVALSMVLLTLAASSFGLFVLQPPQWMLQRAGAAPRIRRRVADGPGDGRGGGAMHRADRAGLAADGRAERQRTFRVRAVLHAGAGPWCSVHRTRDGGRAYPPPAAVGRMAGVDRAPFRVRTGWTRALLPRSGSTEQPDDANPAVLRGRRRNLSRLHFARRPKLASIPGAEIGFGSGRVGGARIHGLSATGAGETSLRAVQLRAARVGDRSAQARADRFQRRLVHPMPRNGAFDLRRSVRGQRGQALRADEGESDRAGQED